MQGNKTNSSVPTATELIYKTLADFSRATVTASLPKASAPNTTGSSKPTTGAAA